MIARFGVSRPLSKTATVASNIDAAAPRRHCARPVSPQTREFAARFGGDHLRRPRRLSPPSPLRARASLRSGCRSTAGAQIITGGDQVV